MRRKKQEILLVFGGEVLLGIMTRAFRDWGYAPHGVSTSGQVDSLLAEFPKARVMVIGQDVQEGLNGLELTPSVKQIRPGIHIVLLAKAFYRGVARERGVDTFVAQPFQLADLWSNIKEVFQKLH